LELLGVLNEMENVRDFAFLEMNESAITAKMISTISILLHSGTRQRDLTLTLMKVTNSLSRHIKIIKIIKITIIQEMVRFDISLLFTKDEVLVRGFRTIKALPHITVRDYTDKNVKRFRSHFGNSPYELSFVWAHLLESTDSGLEVKDKSEKGFKKILTAIHFLWAKPKNCKILATTCGYGCTRHVEGEELWKYVKAIQSLKSRVIVWPQAKCMDPNAQTYIGTIDGVDFKTREKSNDEFNVDKKQFTYKHHHGGVKYELVIDVFEPKIISINGPFDGAVDDRAICEDKVMHLIPEGKIIIADRGYGRNPKDYPGWNNKFALPCLTDSKRLANFKSRARCRHEGVNGLLVDYAILHKEFTHPHDKHVLAFEACCVLVQYKMNHGRPTWDV